MFTCARIKATRGNGADFYRRHLSCNDYFSEHESVSGEWHGSLAGELGLSGKTVEQSVFMRFQQNINPATGGRLTVRNVENAVRFYDFQCSAQKSVSVMSLFDSRLVQAHRDAVRAAMREMENFAAVRLRAGIHANSNNIEFTGNFLYAEYHHDSSRLLDPQLHTHNVIVNVTRDKEGHYKALQSREMVRAIRLASKVYLSELARHCLELGYLLEKKYRDKGELVGFEIMGLPEELLKRCSRRRGQIDEAIEAFVRKHGRQPTTEEVTRITLDTRSRKLLSCSDAEVRNHKLALFSPEEKERLAGLYRDARRRGGMFAVWYNEEERIQALQSVAAQLFERETVVTRDKLLAETLNQHLGKTDVGELKQSLSNVPELLNLEEPAVNPCFTTHEHLERETAVLKLARLTVGMEPPLTAAAEPFAHSQDGFDHSAQKEVIVKILASRDKFQIFRGVAGAGKTSTLQELCRCMRQGGAGAIHVIAPTNSAVDVLRSEGFGSAQTVAKFLQDEDALPPDGTYLIVDEAGLNSIKQGHDMMRLALRHNYRVLFVGDERQHSSVEAGDFLRLLEQYSPVAKTELAEIHRQRHEVYRYGMELTARGETEAAFEHLDRHDFVHESGARYLDDAAKRFLELSEHGRNPMSCLAVAPTNRECDLLTEKIREQLKQAGVLDGRTERPVAAFRSWGWPKERLGNAASYRPGMKIFFTSRAKNLGEPGTVVEVAAVEGRKLRLTDGRSFYPSQFKDRIDAGCIRDIAVAQGDVVRFTVNLKTAAYKINNGSLGIATSNPHEFILLDHDRKPLDTVTLPPEFCGFKAGWVMTSHAAQGMTSENVVVAAEKMSAQAFYVACSRGKRNLSLHIPDKSFFRDRLLKLPAQRRFISEVAPELTAGRCAPVVPPPPARVMGDYLLRFAERVRQEMAEIQKKVTRYIRTGMYHVFHHNHRRIDDERREALRRKRREQQQPCREQPNVRQPDPVPVEPRRLGPGTAERRETIVETDAERRARLVALAERRRRDSSRGFDH